jgi:3-ketosteroid 9alpha-monooxygenase subunit A
VDIVQKLLRETFIGRLMSPAQGFIEAQRARMSEVGRDESERTPAGWAKWATPGWYIVMRSVDLPAGQAVEKRIGGKGLAVYRTASGKPVVVDLYCPHFGGNLAFGKIVGERIQCPFHNWQYDTSGVCVHIPDCHKIPPKARVRSYPVVERFGCVWMFVGDHQYYELPTDQEVFGGSVRFGTVRDLGTIRVDCRDVFENFLDVTHAKTIHGYDVKNYKFLGMEAATRRARFSGDVYITSKLKISIQSTLYGTGLFIAAMEGGIYRHPVYWMIGVQPLEALQTRIFLMSCMKPNGNAVTDTLWAKWYALAHYSGALADLPIWNNKTIQEEPVLCALDIGPIRKFRQYWADLDRIGKTGVETAPGGRLVGRDIANEALASAES